MTAWRGWRHGLGVSLVLVAVAVVALSPSAASAETRLVQGSEVASVDPRALETLGSPTGAFGALSLPGLPSVAQAGGRWIDVRLSGGTTVTAFEGNRLVYRAYAIRGMQGWETPVGSFAIQRRVYNERMVGPGYDVSDVLFTQYFTSMGHSIHYNWWSSNWGGAGSHGCLGMTYGDSAFFWEWAGVGTPIDIHY